MAFDHRQTERHTYRGAREEAEKLIDWLMAKGYRFEVETHHTTPAPTVAVTCSLAPSDIPFTFNR